MGKVLRLLFVLSLGTELSACKPIDDLWSGLLDPLIEKRLNEQTASLRRDLDERLVAQSESLRREIAALGVRLEGTEKALANLKDTVLLNQALADSRSTDYRDAAASIDSDCQGYGVARSNVGAVIVRCEGLSPYLEGFKLRLKATVLAPVEVNGLKVTVSWTETEEKFQEKGSGPYRKKETNSTLVFQPGRYSAFDVVLTPASVRGLKKMYVAVETDQVSILPALQPK